MSTLPTMPVGRVLAYPGPWSGASDDPHPHASSHRLANPLRGRPLQPATHAGMRRTTSPTTARERHHGRQSTQPQRQPRGRLVPSGDGEQGPVYSLASVLQLLR